ncbi:unnamed protein product [Phytomonas sp. EM1]|nr:unnamed protein product [Phytomonas sp. EM1]|eukprot:CCW60736.1 unnamed protein product [Phytomonas sp. isolate EM1]
MISQFYPCVTTNLLTGTCSVELQDGQVVQITDCIEMEVQAGSKKQVDYDSVEVAKLKTLLKRIYLTLFPIPADGGWCDCGMIHGTEPMDE